MTWNDEGNIRSEREGLCGGKGGSMHIADLAKGMMGANGIVGGGPPLICGAALTAKYLKTGGIAVAFVGDGGSNQGTTLESYNLAKVWQLPVIFVVEDNGYAELQQAHGPSAGARSAVLPGLGCRGTKSTDLISLRCMTSRARRSSGLAMAAAHR